MPLSFTQSPDLTLGVELELQILDPETRDLSPASGRVLELLGPDHPNVGPEIFQSMLEVSTVVCRDVGQVRRELEATLAQVRGPARDPGRDAGVVAKHLNIATRRIIE